MIDGEQIMVEIIYGISIILMVVQIVMRIREPNQQGNDYNIWFHL